MLSGFKKFVMRGNVVDLAVAVVMGGAFGAVVTALVKDLLTPIIAAAVGFLLIALAIYVFVIVPMNALTARLNRGEVPPDPTTKKCPECLSEVPIAAKRCAFCTSTLG